MIDSQSVETYLLRLQDTICTVVEAEDGQVQFQEDQWRRQEGGGGARVFYLMEQFSKKPGRI